MQPLVPGPTVVLSFTGTVRELSAFTLEHPVGVFLEYDEVISNGRPAKRSGQVAQFSHKGGTDGFTVSFTDARLDDRLYAFDETVSWFVVESYVSLPGAGN